MMKKKLFFVLMFISPVLFFFGLRFFNYIIGREYQETLKQEIIGAVMCAYTGCIGIWLLYRKQRKARDN